MIINIHMDRFKNKKLFVKNHIKLPKYANKEVKVIEVELEMPSTRLKFLIEFSEKSRCWVYLEDLDILPWDYIEVVNTEND